MTPIVVLNWNGWEDTFRCLESLEACRAEAVWLVDNGSREDRTEAVRVRFPAVRCLRWERNLGYAGGNNRALELATREGCTAAYLLNNDCEVTPGFLDAPLQLLAADPRLAAVGSRVVYGDAPEFLQYDGTGHDPGARPLLPAEGSWPADYALGAGMLLNLAAGRELGLLDERFFCYHEEIEWCFRARRAGWGVAVAGASLVKHHCAGSDTGANALYYQIRNEFLLEECLGSARRPTVRRLVYQGVLHASRAAREGRSDRWQAVAAGLWDGLHGRFGPRPSPPSALALRAHMAWWTAQAVLRDKWRALRGLTPGVG
jgi:GT2 family glycosyltransferase